MTAGTNWTMTSQYWLLDDDPVGDDTVDDDPADDPVLDDHSRLGMNAPKDKSRAKYRDGQSEQG